MTRILPYNPLSWLAWLSVVFLLFCHNQLLSHNVPETKKTVEFVENNGQWSESALFRARFATAEMYLEKNAFQYYFFDETDMRSAAKHPRLFWDDFKTYPIKAHALRAEFAGAQQKTTVLATEPFTHYYNFYQGNDATRWASKAHAYQSVWMNELYPLTDLHIYSNADGAVKYDFILHAGADPQRIKIKYAGAQSIKIKKGYLYIETSVNTLIENIPYAYQLIENVRKDVAVSFRKYADSTIGFEVGNYNPNYDLIIDPLLIFSTYSGSTVDNFGSAATYDSEGNLYTAGITTFSSLGRYPTTTGAFQINYSGGTQPSWPQIGFTCDITISKYNNDGTALLYATYLGGTKNDYPHSLVVDKNQNLLVLGSTLSNDFPVTAGAFDVTHNDSFDIIVTKFNSTGTALIGSTYVGGSHSDGISLADTLCMGYMDHMRGEIQVDANNDVVVGSVTNSVNFPATANAFQTQLKGQQDGCVFKLNSDLTILQWATYIGDTFNETLNSIDFDANGNIYAVGGTHSKYTQIKGSVYDSTYHGGYADAYIAKISSDGNTLQRFMYWGSPDYDQAYFVKTYRDDVYILGQNFDTVPVTNGTYHNTGGSLFISAFSQNLDSLRLSTRIGNGITNNVLVPSAFMVDVCGNIYTSVWGGNINEYFLYRTGTWWVHAVSTTANLPITDNALQTITDNNDFYLFVLSKDADSLLYASYIGELGGSEDHVDGGTSRFDSRGIVYQSVCASCNSGPFGSFPTTADSYSPQNKSPRCSNASLKLDFRISNVVTANFDITPRNGCSDSVFTFTNTSHNSNRQYWYINGVYRDSTFNYQDTFHTAGTYTVKLVTIDSMRCNIIDSIEKTITVGTSVKALFTATRDTCSTDVIFTNQSYTADGSVVPFKWYFGDGDSSSLTNPIHTYKNNGTYLVTLVMDKGSNCQDTETLILHYDTSGHILKAQIDPVDTLNCEPMPIIINNTSINGKQFYWYLADTLYATTKNISLVSEEGVYHFKMKVVDSATCKKEDSVSVTIHVFSQATPNFTISRDTCSFTLNFTNTTALAPGDTVLYKWYFGDGDSSYEVNPTHEYAGAGNYTISLLTNPGLWCEQQRDISFNLDNNQNVLVADFEVQPPIGCGNTHALFTNTSTNGEKFYWYVNSTLEDSTYNYEHQFDTTGTYLIQLIIYDSTSCKKYDTIIKPYSVYDFAESKFTTNRDTCSPTVFFINQTDTSDNIPISYLWQFGDGDTSNQHNVTHNYLNNGYYTVQLITNPYSPCADTSEQIIYYDSSAHILIADFSINDTSFCSPAIIYAVNQSYHNKYNYWYLNNMLVDTSPHFKDTITDEGIYQLKLIVVDSATCFVNDSLVKTIIVQPTANVNFELQRDSCSLKTQLVNTSSISSNNATWHWNFGDGDTSNQKNPEHEFKQTDFYTITLIGNAGTPCADTLQKTYLIDGDSLDEVIIPNVFTPNGDGLNDCYITKGISPKCDEFHIWVRNRWGNLYYESTDPSACWNGQNKKGEDASAGVYFYIINIRKKDGKVINQSGTITLIRE